MKHLAMFFALSPVAFASSTSLSLDEALHHFLDESPAIEAQQSMSEAASNDRWRRFIFNEPTIQFQDNDDHSWYTYGIQLAVPFPFKPFAMMKLDRAKAYFQSHELSGKKYDYSKTIIQAYVDCAAAESQEKIQKMTSDDLTTVFNSLKRLYESGHSTQAEKIGAELQSRQAHFDLIAAQDKKLVACKKMATLMNGEPIPALTLPDDLGSDIIEALGDKTADQHRSIALSELADANRTTAWWSQLPDLNLGMTRNHYAFFPSSPNFKAWTNSFTISVTLPLLFPFHETVEARRARNQAIIDENAADIQKIAADSDQRDGAKEYRRSQNRLRDLRSKDLVLAEAWVESTYSAYRAGKLGYAELVLSRKTRNDLRAQDIQLRVSVINSHLRCLNQCQTLEEAQ